MARYAIVVDRLSDWPGSREGLRLLTADDYLEQAAGDSEPARVVILTRRYAYLTGGYYCSLLAEARGQLPMPTVADVISLSRRNLVTVAAPELEQTLQRTMDRLTHKPTAPHLLHVFLGRPDDTRFRRFAAECFDVFRFPILRVTLQRNGRRWSLERIEARGLHQVPAELAGLLQNAVRGWTRTRRPGGSGYRPPLYSLAVLHDPKEALPPSDEEALQRFERVGDDMRIDVERITRADLRRLPEFDALFLRTTTAIDHFTYEFAHKAELEGLAVIDDTQSILRCANKMYLHELLARHGLATPASVAINRATFDEETAAQLEERLGYPMVLKVPDGSFSRGVERVGHRAELLAAAARLLQQSRLILAQEFVYTTFDWRVGVIGGEALFVCQYRMSRNHWQIYHHRADGRSVPGGHRTLPVDEAPPAVVDLAVRAAGLIGSGLYGVDLKETEKGVLVIEVNDNPNIDHGVEDQVGGEGVYRRVLQEFMRRVDALRAPAS